MLNTIDPATIGERLADARRERRLTQQHVADALNVARTTIVALEKGERRPRASELVKLAQMYGRSVGEFVQPERLSLAPGFLVQFRATGGRRGTGDPKREADIRRFEALCRWYVELEEALGAPLPRRYPAVYDVSGAPPERAAEEVANSERNRLGLGDGPIGDLWGLLETDVGLRVFAVPMEDRRIAGMFVFFEEYGSCIAVNADHPGEQRRSSAAQEYGHFLVDRFRPAITDVNVSGRPPESERFAAVFARSFLMPVAGLSRRFEAIRRAKNRPVTPADVLALSQLYGVSFPAMMGRLEAMKLLPAGTWERLRDAGFGSDRSGGSIRLPAHRPDFPNLPARYVALAVQAFEAGLLTEGELAERLGTDRVGARERVRELTLQSHPSEDGVWNQIPLDLNAALVGAA